MHIHFGLLVLFILHSMPASLTACSYQRDQQLTTLQQQLQALSLQRDDAVLNLSSTQEDLEQTRHELGNLQLVLEQFQKGTLTPRHTILNMHPGRHHTLWHPVFVLGLLVGTGAGPFGTPLGVHLVIWLCNCVHCM